MNSSQVRADFDGSMQYSRRMRDCKFPGYMLLRGSGRAPRPARRCVPDK